MKKLINFAVNLMEKENRYLRNPDLLPSQNPELNPTQNFDINVNQNPEINDTQNPNINLTQNLNWKRNQWELFKETILWDYLSEPQKEKCKNFLQRL